MITLLRLALIAAALAPLARSQEDPVRVTAAPRVVSGSGGATVLRLTLDIRPPYHIYSTQAQLGPRGAGPMATSLALRPGAPVSFAGAPRTSPPLTRYDPSFELEVQLLEGKAWIEVPLRVADGTPAGEHPVTLRVSYQACDDQSCLPPAEVEIPLIVQVPSDAAAVPPVSGGWEELSALLADANAPPSAGARGGREARMERLAELAWALSQAHPTDPRRWLPWETLLRSGPSYRQDAKAKQAWDERVALILAAIDADPAAPVVLRELAAGRKVSALVLPFTNGELPSDWWPRLVPAIDDLGRRFPEGSGAFVYFSRLVSAVEAQDAAALPRLVARMAESPNAKVRELAARRQAVLQALAEPAEFVFTALDGREVDTRRWRGRVVLVDFWATWCVPCIESVPHLKELYARYHDRGLEIIHVSVDQASARDALVKLVARLEIPWPQAFDGRGPQTPFAVRYGVQPIPHVLLVGPDGRVAAVNPRGAKLEQEIVRLLPR